VILAGARERAVDIGAGAVTPAVGALLSLLAKLSGGKAVAEVGTGAGVSGLWLLSGISSPSICGWPSRPSPKPASDRRAPG
jgi:predicted O-methyltransferase YrrM